jgi:hypothetical protein
MLRDTPLVPQDVPSCLSKHPKRPTTCSFPTAEAAHRDRVLLVAEKAAAGSRLTTVDLTDVICPSTTCHVVTRNGTIKYRDEHHLTARYSARLWQVLAERIDRRLPRVTASAPATAAATD